MLYQEKHSFEHRLNESSRILSKYPDRIPIIVEPAAGTDLVLDKFKYLVPAGLSVGQLIYVIRKRLKLDAEKAIFLFTCRNTLPPTSATLSQLYNELADDDKFIYFTVSTENTFG